MTTMSLAEVKAHLSEIVQRVNGQHERVTVTVHGHASAILLAPDDLERMEETIAVLSDNNLLTQLSESTQDEDNGRIESADDLAAAMHGRRSAT